MNIGDHLDVGSIRGGILRDPTPQHLRELAAAARERGATEIPARELEPVGNFGDRYVCDGVSLNTHYAVVDLSDTGKDLPEFFCVTEDAVVWFDRAPVRQPAGSP